ncbi:hypothetical protein M422DRAFT_35565 [Sphaerobolus stellatus SS14]|uniref:Homeobox domain-containing protein n=1 Tax=Sphaerobolus stellatus (strain SS14) TaxID=990650 RepID=A0A0C9UEG4_SPHS4|nr:hypothetical protein M422DRAFT_35565 [Sphaerobolus stellatus SS14]
MPAPSAFTFHPYEHTPASPFLGTQDDKQHHRTRVGGTAPFPTFLYASEPPPLTARNKQRVRPSPSQLQALKELYAVSAHPSREVRESLGQRIGMRYQSVTNWFQNQRSTAKRRPTSTENHHDEIDEDSHPTRTRGTSICSTTHTVVSTRAHSPTPSMYSSVDDDHHFQYVHQAPPQTQRTRRDPVKDIIDAQAAARQQLQELSLPLSGAAIVSSYPNPTSTAASTPATMYNVPLPPISSSRATSPGSGSTSLLSSFQVSRASSPAHSHHRIHHSQTSPHAHAMGDEGLLEHLPPRAGKRSRPTPKQLSALRALHAVTESPTIEERIQLGKEIGMELGKVTNWFRNLRQTARKKERKALEAEGKTLAPVKRSRPPSSSGPPLKRARLSEEREEHDGYEEHEEYEEDEEYAYAQSQYSHPPSPHHQHPSHHTYPSHHARPHITDEPSSSETETASVHEAITPPLPQHSLPHVVSPSQSQQPTERLPVIPQERREGVKEGDKEGATEDEEEEEEDVSMDDAMLLLALYRAPA